MKKVMFMNSGITKEERLTADNLQEIIREVRNGDMDATASLLQQFHRQVVSVANDVLQDETLAKESARETLENAVKQLRRGVYTGAFEPWLMWLTRSDALRYIQIRVKPEISPNMMETISCRDKTGPDRTLHSNTRNAPKYGIAPLVVLRTEKNMPLTPKTPLKPEYTIKRYDPENCESAKSDASEKIRKNADVQRRSPEEKEESTTEKVKRSINRPIVLSGALVVLCLALIWITLGLIAKNTGANIPDIGYSWFNNNLFPMF